MADSKVHIVVWSTPVQPVFCMTEFDNTSADKKMNRQVSVSLLCNTSDDDALLTKPFRGA